MKVPTVVNGFGNSSITSLDVSDSVRSRLCVLKRPYSFSHQAASLVQSVESTDIIFPALSAMVIFVKSMPEIQSLVVSSGSFSHPEIKNKRIITQMKTFGNFIRVSL